MKIQGSAAQHWGFPFLYSTQKRAANSQPSTAGSDFLITSPKDNNSTNWAEPKQRKSNSHELFCCHIKYERFGTRGSVTLLITLQCRTAPFEKLTLTFCRFKLLHNHTWGGCELQWTFIWPGRFHPAEEINEKAERKRQNREAVLFSAVTSQKC